MKSLVTYTTRLKTSQEEKGRIISTLLLQRDMVNFCSKEHFGSGRNSIVDLHAKCYRPLRELYPDSPSQLVIRAEQECLSSYRTVKSNKHHIKSPITKKNLSCRLDKRLYTFPSRNTIKMTALGGKRIKAQYTPYPKLISLLGTHSVADPLIFVRDNEVWIALSFEISSPPPSEKMLAIGVDLGKRNLAATSDGKLISGREFNKHKRKIRSLKRSLQSKNTKSSRRHLGKVRRREANFSKNYTHHVANEILRTEADVIVLEDLTKIKKKKHKYQNKNNISQVPFYLLRQILEHKAILLGKETLLRSPAFTSQRDYSDLNAANNIALKSKLPSLLINPVNSFRRQGVVNRPIVDSQIKFSLSEKIYKPVS